MINENSIRKKKKIIKRAENTEMLEKSRTAGGRT